MPETERITLTIRVDQVDKLEDLANNDDPRWRSKSEAARHLLDEADRVEELEQTIDRLQNEKEVIISEYQEDEPDEITPASDSNNPDSFLGRLSWLIRGSN